jgi:hypothetical protein
MHILLTPKIVARRPRRCPFRRLVAVSRTTVNCALLLTGTGAFRIQQKLSDKLTTTLRRRKTAADNPHAAHTGATTSSTDSGRGVFDDDFMSLNGKSFIRC